jgi:hypothetical protein
MDYLILAFKQIPEPCCYYGATFMQKFLGFFIFLAQLTSFKLGLNNFNLNWACDSFNDFKSFHFFSYCY